jgi:putative nucleotidyltransferase-like protein
VRAGDRVDTSAAFLRGALSLGVLVPRLPPERALELVATAPEDAAALLGQHKVVQLAAARLDAAGEPGARLLALLEPALGAARRRATLSRQLVDQLPDLASDVVLAGMKGVAATRWYPSDGMRDVSDVDLWVPDAAHAARLYRQLAVAFGYEICPDELPWFKRGPREAYGVIMLHPPNDDLVHVDIHFGDYSVAHCASFPVTAMPVRQEPAATGMAMLQHEDNLCCAVANAAGDYFADLKSLNDLYLCLRREDMDWARVRATLDRVGLLGFLGVMLARIGDLFVLDDAALAGMAALGDLPRLPGPPLTGVTPRERCRATVRHAAAIGRGVSSLHAARLGLTAYRYYRRPLRLSARRAFRPFRIHAVPWKCTRLIPPGMVESLLPGTAPRQVKTQEIDFADGIEIVRAAPGDLIRLGGDIFLPTVYYRVDPLHAAAAVTLAHDQAKAASKGALSMTITYDAREAARLLDDIPVEGAQTIFLSGSVAEGWSSEGSNYNLYVIGDPPPGVRPMGGYSLPPEGTRVPGHHFLSGSDRVLIRYWKLQDVSWTITAVREHELRPMLEIWPPAIEFLHRLSIGIPLHGEDRFEELRAALDVDMLARYITQNRAMHAESFYTDAVTRLRAGRHFDALLQARIAYECSVDAYLASRGETNPQPKWRHKKIVRVAGNGILRDDFEQAMAGPGQTGRQEVEASVVALIQRASTLNCCIQLGCEYAALAVDAPTPVGEPLLTRALEARLSRRHDGRTVVADLLTGKAAELSPIAALVFGCADGRWSASQIAGHAGAYLGRASRADVAEVVLALGERGLVREV